MLKEPSLLFGNGEHICPKAGIENLGVYDTNDDFRQTELSLGIIGRGEGIDSMDVWLEECKNGLDPKKSNFPNLFKGFMGFSKQKGFYTNFRYGEPLIRTIQKTALNKAIKLKSRDERVKKCVELYYDQIRFLAENRTVDTILCVISDDMFDAVTIAGSKSESSEEESNLEYNFRRLLKARSMHLRVPLQLVLEKSLNVQKKSKGQQDAATRAWNFCTAVYYKGNKTIPWRLSEEDHRPKTCYIGIGFYKSRDGKIVHTSLAQVFDEFGHGIILRGSPVSIDKNDRRPYMTKDQAYDLLSNALKEYDLALMQMPARVVLHKTSNFKQSEIDGFNAVLESKSIRMKDFVTILNSRIRLHSYQAYPPPRGTLLTLAENKGVLYTRGLVDFYKTYPGMYVPTPLEVRMFDHDSSLEDVCKEILGLSKMNWNNTQLDGRLPITLECAKRVGDIMKYVGKNEIPQVSYSYYM